MAKPRVDSKGNRLTVNRDRPSATVHASNVDNHADGNLLLTAVAGADTLRGILDYFADHGGGYLKLRRSEPGADLHITWTWSATSHAGKYVYVRVEFWRYLFGLELLRQKIDEVEAGLRKATPDKMGGGRS